MRICLIYHGGDYPPYERIDKMAKTLSAAGHEIFLLCNNYGKYPLSEEIVGSVHVLRLRPRFPGRLLNRVLKFPIFFNPLWLVQIWNAVRRFRIDAIQVIDLPLAAAALAICRMLRVPVVMDMWENYPEVLKIWAQLDWKTRMFKNPTVARVVERWVVRSMDHIVVVVEEQKERLIADGVMPQRITVVTNAVDVDMLTGAPVRTDTPLDHDAESYKLLYVGIVTNERGLDDIIRALPLARRHIPNVRLYIVGKGNFEPQLRQLAHQLGVADCVRFLGWVPFNDIHSYMSKCDLGLAPFVKNGFSDTTVPNKLFQYMLMSKPVLVSNARPLARIVRECSCGFVFESRNAEDAAGAIEMAYRNRADASIGERGRHCVQAGYTWEKASRPLVSLYDQIKLDRIEDTDLRLRSHRQMP